jgi:hypothetical protein
MYLDHNESFYISCFAPTLRVPLAVCAFAPDKNNVVHLFENRCK